MSKLMQQHIAILVLCAILFSLSACTSAETSSGETPKVSAKVIEIEKYGHAVLDITTAELISEGYALGDIVCVHLQSYNAEMPFFDGYYSTPGTVMLRGLTAEDQIALCINYGDFSDEAEVSVGDSVEITLAEKAGMLAIQELCALQYTNRRDDYPNDAAFANFRAVTAGRIGNGKLYRTASPINNINGRASYANDLISSAGVAIVLNLADSPEDIEALFAAPDFNSSYYRELYNAGNVKALDLAGNFFSESFAVSVADGLTFLAQKSPPYCIHCTEGKDRAGYIAMLLEALMGADLYEIIDDYMITFYNYYGIDQESEPERYQIVLDNNLIAILCHITGADTKEELSQIDLEAATAEYLLRAGMKEEDIITLKEKLH